METLITPHFSLDELTRTKPGIPNDVPMALAKNLVLIAQKLEQARAILGVPLRVSYAYRCPELNKACGSTSTTSAHLLALAADIIPRGRNLREAWEMLSADPEFMVDIDQLIVERGCVHIGLAVPAHDNLPRHELRTELLVNGERHYPLFGHWTPQGVVRG